MFAFGVMVYHLLTRQYPFGLPDDPDDLNAYRSRCIDGKWNSSLLRGMVYGHLWRKIIEGCLNPDYVARFRSADDVMPLLPPEIEDPEVVGIANVADLADVADVTDIVAPASSSAPEAIYRFDRPEVVITPIALRVIAGSERGKVYQLNSLLHTSRVITVGRGLQNLVYLREQDSVYISRMHCTIEANENYSRWRIRDGQLVIPEGERKGSWKQSTNGTFVDAKRISIHGTELRAGSVIKIGTTILQVEESAPM